MKLNLDNNLVDIKGEPQNQLLCHILADILATSSTHKPAQTIAWAYDLIKEGEIEINKSDIDFISEIVIRSQFIDLAKAQLLDELKKLKE